MQVIPEVVEFGRVAIGSSVERSVLIRNRGRGAVSLQAVEVPEGIRLNPSSFQLMAAEQASVEVVLLAGAVGSAGGTIRWETSQGERLSVEVRATVSSSPVSFPTAIDFGEVMVGTTKAVDIEVESFVAHEVVVALPTPGHEDLRWTDESIVIPPQSRSWVSLLYAPSSRGDIEEVLTMQSCEACEPHELQAVGRGIDYELTLTPSGVDFGVVAVGFEASASLRFTNTGDLPLDLELDQGLVRPPFKVDAELTEFGLEPGEELSFGVRFRPTAGGLQGVPLRVKERASSELREIPLVGVGGSRLVGIPAALDFGLVPTGYARRMSVLLQNIGLPRTVEIRSVGFGAYSPAFRVVDQRVGAEIGANPIAIEVEFRSWDEGVYAAELLVRTSDTQQDLRVPLRGEAGFVPPTSECELGLHPPMLDIGLIPMSWVARRKVFLVNEGSVPCFVREIRWRPPYLATVPTLHPFAPSLLEPGESTIFEVSFIRFSLVPEASGIDIFLGAAELPSYASGHRASTAYCSPLVSQGQLIYDPTPIDTDAVLTFEVSDPCGTNFFRSIALSAETSDTFALVQEEVLEPGAEVDGLSIEVRFTPTSPGFHHGQVELKVSDFQEPLRIDLIGVGLEP